MKKPHLHNNFAFLLAGLLFLFALPPALLLYFGESAEGQLMRVLLLIGYSLFTLISVWSLYRERWIFKFGLGLAAITIAIAVASLFVEHRALEILAVFLVITFSALSCYIVARQVFSLRDTNANSLIGAVCVYMLLGLIWCLLYTLLLALLPPGAFQGLSANTNATQFDGLLYFSFVTLTTAGYGDILPVHPLARTLAYLEMITGQFYMAILVSGLVAHFMGLRMTR
ncbi:MAG: potassium channel family protein [Candidatus Methylumidiphilus sp.]